MIESPTAVAADVVQIFRNQEQEQNAEAPCVHAGAAHSHAGRLPRLSSVRPGAQLFAHELLAAVFPQF